MVRQQARYHGYYDWLTDYGDAAMVTPPVSGTYYIDACGYDRQFGDYSVTVRLQTVVNADTIAELTTDVPFIEVEGSVS